MEPAVHGHVFCWVWALSTEQKYATWSFWWCPKNTQQKPKHVGLEEAVCNIWMVPKIGNTSKFIHFNKVFHYFHHPFWGPTPIFGNTHIPKNHAKTSEILGFPQAWIGFQLRTPRKSHVEPKVAASGRQCHGRKGPDKRCWGDVEGMYPGDPVQRLRSWIWYNSNIGIYIYM